MKARAISLGCRPMPQDHGKQQATIQGGSAKMFARQVPASPEYLGGFTRKGILVVQALVMNARSLVARAGRDADCEASFDREEFADLVRQLMTQRSLIEEILNDEGNQCDFDCELDDLRRFLEQLCQETEATVLAGQADRARASGEEEIALRIEGLLG